MCMCWLLLIIFLSMNGSNMKLSIEQFKLKGKIKLCNRFWNVRRGLVVKTSKCYPHLDLAVLHV